MDDRIFAFTFCASWVRKTPLKPSGVRERSLHNLRLNSGDILLMAFYPVHHMWCATVKPGDGKGGAGGWGGKQSYLWKAPLCRAPSVKNGADLAGLCNGWGWAVKPVLLSLIHVSWDSLRRSWGAAVGDTEMEADPVGGWDDTVERIGTRGPHWKIRGGSQPDVDDLILPK